jgi:predicted O-methyltransferase YrrM
MDQIKIDFGDCRLGDMNSKIQLSVKWFRYLFLASNSRGHGIHSPFVYELVREVLNDKREYYAYGKIESVRAELLVDQKILHIEDFGAGSSRPAQKEKKISEIAGGSLSSKKFGRLLFRLAHFYRAQQIIELGSSLGISASYLASADAGCRVITMEGSPEIACVAAQTFKKLGLKNIILATGRFEETMGKAIPAIPKADLVFLDGNHRKKPVLEYFEHFLENITPASLVIVHDIHWSAEMEEAWAIIRNHPGVKMTVDIFSAGLVFFREEFQVKQHFMIRF